MNLSIVCQMVALCAAYRIALARSFLPDTAPRRERFSRTGKLEGNVR